MTASSGVATEYSGQELRLVEGSACRDVRGWVCAAVGVGLGAFGLGGQVLYSLENYFN